MSNPIHTDADYRSNSGLFYHLRSDFCEAYMYTQVSGSRSALFDQEWSAGGVGETILVEG